MHFFIWWINLPSGQHLMVGWSIHHTGGWIHPHLPTGYFLSWLISTVYGVKIMALWGLLWPCPPKNGKCGVIPGAPWQVASISIPEWHSWFFLRLLGDLSPHPTSFTPGHTQGQVRAVACSTLHRSAAFCAFWLSHEYSSYAQLLSAVARLQSSVSESALCVVHL